MKPTKPHLATLACLLPMVCAPFAAHAETPAEPAVEESQPAATARPATPGTIIPLPPPDSLGSTKTATSFTFGEFDLGEEAPKDSLTFNLNSQFESNHTSGPGKASSFLDVGDSWLHDLEVNALNHFENGWQTDLNAAVRYTNSRRYDPRELSLQTLRLVASKADDTITAGDYYATFSQYSLNRSIKGLGYQHNFDDNTYVRMAAGTFDPRWDHLLSDTAGETIDRYITAMRGQTGREDANIGMNLVWAADRNDDPSRTTQDTYRQVLPSIDWEYKMESGLRLDGEHAVSFTRRQTAATHVEKHMTGTANRVNLQGSLGALRIRGRAERVAPDFVSMGGGAALDRLRFYGRADYRLDKTWRVFAAYDWFRNNLEQQLAQTTRTAIPEIGVDAKGLFDRRSLTFSTSLRERKIWEGAPVSQKNTSDRIYVSLGDRFDQVSLRGEVEANLNTRSNSATMDNDDLLYRFTVDSRHKILDGKYDLRPYFSIQCQDAEDPTTGATIRTDGFTFDLQLLTDSDMTYGLNVESTKTDNDVAGSDDTRTRRLALNFSSEPEIFMGGTLRGEAGYADYRFTTTSKNYRENYVRLMLGIPFSFGN
ncbi:MAG TPA: hypothetical protein DCW68_06670 [Rhodospirillaceae bacterium]|nr:MAG: hypothetical protein A2018_01180 [Alphaproteobacteria bacterium GWF2_58_20]HAU29770.1 hypothetical protein [Rhodospirillaceae bacterium]